MAWVSASERWAPSLGRPPKPAEGTPGTPPRRRPGARSRQRQSVLCCAGLRSGVQRLVERLDPMPDWQPGAALQVRDATDVGRQDGVRGWRAKSLAQGEQFALAQLLRQLRLEHRVGAC